MANTVAPSVARLAFLLLGIAALLTACAAGGSLDDPAQATPTVADGMDGPAPTGLPFSATQTAEADLVPYVIERIVLTTELEGDGEPANEVSVLSQEQQNVFLAVRVRGLAQETSFQAIWFEGDEVIGQSNESADADDDDSQWVALPFRSIAALNPAAAHSVELLIDERRVNTFAFRVGVGNPDDVIAEAELGVSINEEGELQAEGDTFDRFVPQIVLMARVSNQVDPTGMIFTAHWMRGNVPLAQTVPDGGQPRLGGEAEGENPRLMTFTLTPQGSLIPGDHTVSIHLNGSPIAEYDFTIATDDEDVPGTEPTEEVEPTPTEEPPSVTVNNIVVTDEVDEDTSEPDDGLNSLDAYPSQLLELIVTIELEDLSIDNRIEFTVGIGGGIIERYQLPVAALEDGWLATPVDFRAPDIAGRTVEYEIIVYVDGVWSESSTFSVVANQEAPPATPTPNPFDLDDEDDDDND